jgi:hypothetical protein
MTKFQARPLRVLPGFLLAMLALVFGGAAASAREAEVIPAARIQQIAAWLPVQPAGFGQPITNRAAWNAAAREHPEWQEIISRAVKLAAQPLPAQPDNLYLEFSKNGNRSHWQKVAGTRRERIEVFTLAECLENHGRFIAPLEKTIAALCAERTWVLPAHDGQLENFTGEQVDIDLGSSTLGVELATANYLLGDRLSPATRQLIRANLERRIFAPYRAAIDGTGKGFWWIHTQNNWNAVCLDGVTGAALATISSPAERAWYIAVAEQNIGAYLAGGFTADGYCVEGLGYWNYGFGNFMLLAENLREATGGNLDLLAQPAAAQPALFGLRAEILNDVFTTIADCHPGETPSEVLMNYLCRRLGCETARWRDARLSGSLYQQTAMAFLRHELPPLRVENYRSEFPWRTWFPESGVLICRPGTGAKVPFAVAIKGGNNGVNHGHNDVGSFSVVVGTNMVICDPGGEVYTKRTFSAHRFDSQVLNSFGHAVPVVGGQLQASGAAARAVVLHTNFTEAADTLKFDLRPAYPVRDLQMLQRTFTYQRGENPSLTVRDEVKFSRPDTFESVLVTWGAVRAAGPNALELTDVAGTVRVAIDTQGRAFHWRQEIIRENVQSKRQPIHVGIRLDDKITAGIITLRVTPMTK